MSESDQSVAAYIDQVREFYEWVTKTISDCAYRATEMQEGEAAWSPLRDAQYNGTLASWADTLNIPI